ncbi:uncharacterized protein LOC143570849 [Bidens hawaiensis]|uniref:uncharacterized protein LOC143570849 n=1 Tax=Bidens hawaiensis TaxID=980011 RepID=UPI00404ABCAA
MNQKPEEFKRKWNGNPRGQYKRNFVAGRMFVANTRGTGGSFRQAPACNKCGKNHTANHKFNIDLLPVELGNIDIVVGMDWQSKNGADIIYSDKLVRLPIQNGESLTIQGDQCNPELKLSSITKTRKILRKGYPTYLVNVVDTKAKGRRIDDIPVVKDFPEVFLKDLSRLPPQRQFEFRIDLVQDAAPIALSPYRLAPSEMQELSNQLRELLDK